MFISRLLPLLEFEREIPTVDLSKVTLAYHKLKDKGISKLDLDTGDAIALSPLAPGGGSVQEKEKAFLWLRHNGQPIFQCGLQSFGYKLMHSRLKNQAKQSLEKKSWEFHK